MRTNIIKCMFTLAKSNIQTAMIYKTNFVLGLSSIFVLIFVHFNLWKVIFETNDLQEINGYSFSLMLSYVILSRIFYVLVNSMSFEEKVAKEIKDGRLSIYLTKPFDYLVYNLFSKLGDVCIQFLVSILAIVLIVFIWPNSMILNFKSIFLAFPTIFFGLLLNTLIGYTFALSAFWIEQADILFVFKKNIINFISGVWIPISFFPAPLKSFLHFLPFDYLQYFSIEIILDQITVSQVIEGLIIQTFWVMAFYILGVFMWEKGVKKYMAFGG